MPPQVAASAAAQFANSGDSDASPAGAPSQFLLVRGLEPTVTEELLAKGVAKLYKPSATPAQSAAIVPKKGNGKVASTTGDSNLGAKDNTIRRVLLVRDRQSNESWRYGFAEFASVDVIVFRSGADIILIIRQDAQAALIRYNSFEKFTISSKPVTACYIHAGVFVPVLEAQQSSEKNPFTFGAAASPGLRLRYWDEGAYASELVVSQPEEVKVSTSEAARSAADAAAAAAEKEGLLSQKEANEAKVKKRKAELKESTKLKKV